MIQKQANALAREVLSHVSFDSAMFHALSHTRQQCGLQIDLFFKNA